LVSRRKEIVLEDHKEHALDELLEAMYKAQEDGRLPVKPENLPLASIPTRGELSIFAGRNLIVMQDGTIDMAPKGQEIAELLVRRHRLAERLFSEILNLDDSGLNSTSCSFEHILDPAVIESVCTMLGHPPTCPHGKRIPPGDCCRASQKEVAPIVMSLKDLPVGSNAKIVFITTPYHQRLSRLINLGVIPGGRIFLHQKRPSYLLRLGSTEIAIDEQIASEIFVRRI
jgi:DtxR family Mn-dependent transcriptional regulator